MNLPAGCARSARAPATMAEAAFGIGHADRRRLAGRVQPERVKPAAAILRLSPLVATELLNPQTPRQSHPFHSGRFVPARD
jgi:hypothetical protein